MPQDDTHSASAADWPAQVPRPRLITPFHLGGLMMAVGIVLVLLFPQRRLSEQIRSNPKIDEVSLQYMRNLLATEPDNYELRLDLARDHAALGQYSRALTVLLPLYTHPDRRWREAAYLEKLDILAKIAYAAQPGSLLRNQEMARFMQALHDGETQVSSLPGLKRLAGIAAANDAPLLAEQLTARYLHYSRRLADFDNAAGLALANGHYLDSASYDWHARQLADNSEQKAYYLKKALAALEAGGMGATGLEWVLKLDTREWQRPDILYRLTQLALASNQPKLAADLAARLTGLTASATRPVHFIPAYFELAYTAFLGNREVAQALTLAQIAVERTPESGVWHVRLAQLDEWTNHPQQALIQWRWLALHKGGESAWQAWMRLAGNLYDYAAEVLGLEHALKRHGNDERYAHRIVQLYEYMGEPEKALAWLDLHADDARHPSLLLLSAELLTRMGRDQEALIRYRHYLKHDIAAPDTAVVIAGIMQRAGHLEEAFDVLERSRPQALPGDKTYWLTLGELAWRSRHYDQAVIAYRILSAAADAPLFTQQRLFEALKKTHPHEAARLAIQFWRQNGRIELFLNAAETYADLHDWAAVQRLYALADRPEWRNYAANFRFLALRAEMYKQTGAISAAVRDDRFLIEHYPADPGLKESFLWLLLDSRLYRQLDYYMHEWLGLLPSTPRLWDVYAAGYLASGQPDYALALYHRMAASHAGDELWQLNYASTLEAAGQPKAAWQIRRRIWRQRLTRPRNKDLLAIHISPRDLETLRLRLLNDPASGQTVLWKLLRQADPALMHNSQFVELASAWLNSRGQNDSLRGWLIRQYAHWLDTPLGARISDALLHQDREAANEILDHDGVLPYDNMNLDFLTGRLNDAADLAFTAMDRSRRDAALYEQAAPMLLANDHGAGLMSTYRNLDSYSEIENEIQATGQRIGNVKMDASVYRTTRFGVNTAFLASAPNESGGRIALQKTSDSSTNTFKFEFSRALNTQTGIEFLRVDQLSSRLQFTSALAYNQTADENAAMRIVGRRNRIALAGDYQIDNWNQWEIQGALNQYHSIDGQSMGSGHVFSTTLDHNMGDEYPALQTRLTGTWEEFHAAQNILTGKAASLLPYGVTDGSGFFMPLNVHEIAAYLRAGDTTDSSLPAHDLEFMSELGMYYDTVLGTGLRASAALAGRVIGADRLQIFIRYDQAAAGQNETTLEAGIAYQLHY